MVRGIPYTGTVWGGAIVRIRVVHAPVAQPDRALGCGPKGRGFESLRAHHFPIQWVTWIGDCRSEWIGVGWNRNLQRQLELRPAMSWRDRLHAAANAVVDALLPFGVRYIDMPFRPKKVWAAMQTGWGVLLFGMVHDNFLGLTSGSGSGCYPR
jgi:hypothetical protein